MKEILQHLLNYQTLSQVQACQLLVEISKNEHNDGQIAAFMAAYIMRSPRVEELRGFKQAMLELCVPVNLGGMEAIDICGTGGDGKDTFNISTTASFIVAGAGTKVAKHGNYGVSSSCGSSTVMQALGYDFSNNESKLLEQIDRAGICFMHAPLFHPAMKRIMPIRQQLAIKTFFNMLGPMVNPAKPTFRLTGVFSLELARLYTYLYQKESLNFGIVHSIDGYDEVSLTDAVRFTSSFQGERLIWPWQMGFEIIQPNQIAAPASAEASADLLMKILQNKAPKHFIEVCLANAALALQVASAGKLTLENAKIHALESLESGKALQSLKTLISLT